MSDGDVRDFLTASGLDPKEYDLPEQPTGHQGGGGSAGQSGLALNNPLNLRPRADAPWPGQVGVVNGFAKFGTLADGWNAADVNLRAKVNQHGLKTLDAIVGHPTWGWAPAADHNDPQGYASAVADRLGVGPDDDVQQKIANDSDFRHRVLRSMAQQEVGQSIPFGGATPEDDVNAFLGAHGVADQPSEAPPGTQSSPTPATKTAAPDSAWATAGQIVQDVINPGGLGLHGLTNSDPRANAIESGLQSGVLMGGKNELGAAIRAAPALVTGGDFRNSFSGNLQALDQQDAALESRFPIAHGVGAGVGALASTALGGEAGNLFLRGAGAAIPAVSDAINANRGLALASRFGTRAASGALAGAAQGYLAGGLNANGQELTGADREAAASTGGEWGAGLGVAIPEAAAFVSQGAKFANGLLAPFSESGRSGIINSFLRANAAGGPTALDLAAHVPGSTPTLAQATANPGLATIERGLRMTNPMPFAMKQTQNAEARSAALDAMKGDGQSLSDMIEARSAAADPARAAVFANAKPVDASPAVQTIDEILAGPSGKRDAVRTALTNIRSKLVKSVDLGGDSPVLQAETDPNQLYGVRQAIGDMLDARGSGTESDSRLATHELINVRNALDPVIESGAPGFRGYLKNFAEASGPIEAQRFLQAQNLTDSNGAVTLGRVDSTLKRIEKMRAQPGANAAKSISDEAMNGLYGLRSDLQRQSNSELGRFSGSDTAQKLATSNLLSQISNPTAWALGTVAHHPIVGAGVALGKLALGAKDKQLYEELTNRMLNPYPGTMAQRPISILGRLGQGLDVVGANSPALAARGRDYLYSGPNGGLVPAAQSPENRFFVTAP